MATHSAPFFAPALLVILGCMDPAKWVTAVEGGCRFGFELLWVLIISNFVAFLVDYLSTMLGSATGKNLAQICHDEYPQSVCFLLWLQLEISVVLLETTMILSIAVGLNFLLGLSFVPCVFVSEVFTVLFLIILLQVGIHRMEVFTASALSLTLLCFVLDSLYNNATTAAAVSGMVPRLKGESLYTALSIFGANITPASLYLHSRFTQEKRGVQISPIWSPFRDVIIDSGFSFLVAFMVNFAVLSSAAATFHSSGLVVITLQDAQALVEQILGDSVAPAAFMLALFCASQFSSYTRIVAGQVALEGFIDVTVPVSLHQIFMKMIAFLAALLFVWSSGSEGIYQILVFSKVILALQLPFALVPLIRVTSSQVLMGDYKNSFFVEAAAWVFVALMSITNVWLVFDIFFGETDEWMGSRSWNFISDFGHSSTIQGEIVHILVISCIISVAAFSTGLVMWMASKPLKIDDKLDTSATVRSIELPAKFDDPTVQENISSKAEIMEPIINSICENDKPLRLEHLALEEKLREVHPSDSEQMLYNKDKAKPDVHSRDNAYDLDDKTSFPELVETSENVQDINLIEGLSSDSVSSVKSSLCNSFVNISPPDSVTGSTLVISKSPSNSLYSTISEGAVVDVDGELLDIDGWENLEQEDIVRDSVMSSFNSLISEESFSGRHIGTRSDASEASGCGSGSGSLSRLSGLGRAARRQFAAMLDDFWGKLFDLHGQPISHHQETLSPAKYLNSERGRQGSMMEESSEKDTYSWKGMRPSWQKEIPSVQLLSHSQSSYETPLSSAWCGHHPVDVYNLSERRYSSLHFPLYHEEHYQQPATIHGYKSASYANRFGIPPLEVNNRRAPNTQRKFNSLPSVTAEFNQSFPFDTTYNMASTLSPSNFHLDQQKYSIPAPLYLSSYKPTSNPSDKWQGIQLERHMSPSVASSYGTSSSVRMDGGTWNPLVYRATGELDLQDVNMRASSSKSSKLSSSLPQSPISRRGYSVRSGNVEYIGNRNERTPLSFDELSPSQLHKDGFSIQSSQAEDRSLWARQPFEQLFGSMQASASSLQESHRMKNDSRTMEMHQKTSSGIDRQRELLNDMRSCIVKLLRLDGFEWLFRLDTGSDEDVVALIARRESVLIEAEMLTSQRLNGDPFSSGNGQTLKASARSGNETGLIGLYSSGVPHCGQKCMWRLELLISFGVWCIHRILELSLMESRPELWGKYTYVLNRLQGILEPAFSKPRTVPSPCLCAQSDFDSQGPIDRIEYDGITGMAVSNLSNGPSLNSFQGLSNSWSRGLSTTNNGKGASASAFIDIIKEVETAISMRKGRTGTAAGDVAFPKGKENLASVLKRYKRRLSNKPPGAVTGLNAGNRKAAATVSAL